MLILSNRSLASVECKGWILRFILCMLMVRTSNEVSFTSAQKGRKWDSIKVKVVCFSCILFVSFFLSLHFFFLLNYGNIWLCNSQNSCTCISIRTNIYSTILHFKKKTSFEIIWKNYKRLFFLYRRGCGCWWLYLNYLCICVYLPTNNLWRSYVQSLKADKKVLKSYKYQELKLTCSGKKTCL